MIDRQVAHLTRLVDDLLDVARITQRQDRAAAASRRSARRDRASARRDRRSPRRRASGHQLRVTLPAEPLGVDGDLTRLAQVVHQPAEQRGEIHADGGTHRGRRRASDGDEAVVAVRDNGIGIAAELLPRVFDLFGRPTAALDRAQGGLGIGLTLVRAPRRAARRQRRGAQRRRRAAAATFTVRLPLARPAGRRGAAARRRASPIARSSRDPGRRRQPRRRRSAAAAAAARSATSARRVYDGPSALALAPPSSARTWCCSTSGCRA